MRVVIVLLACLMSGCGTFTNIAMDRAGKPIVDLALDYCKARDYRKEALGVLINGRLATVGIEILIVCPTD